MPGETASVAPLTTTPAGNFGWPTPPADRDPRYVGRPGSNDPVRSFLVDKTLLYVNEYGRPTIVDLTTGDQREVLIAEGRSQDMFELEFGQIVTTDTVRSDLPLSVGRSIGVIGVRADLEIESVDDALIVLCVDESGCSAGSRSPATLMHSLDTASQLDSSVGAEAAIGELIGVSTWTTEHRWTLFGLDPDDPDHVLRIPTPLPNTAIWLVSQRR